MYYIIRQDKTRCNFGQSVQQTEKAGTILASRNLKTKQLIRGLDMTNSGAIPNLKTVSQFCEAYPAFTIGSVRNFLFYGKQNGLEDMGAVKRLGAKILIDCDRFFEWLDTNPSITGRGV